jgi:hypothetical protein
MIAYFLAYNEINLLPLQHQWCNQQRIEMFVIDNMSTDGTKEYLEKNNIRHISIDTDGAFHLTPLLEAMTLQIHIDRPKWFIYAGMDMFFVTERITIPQMTVLANILGYNSVSMQQITFYHTKPDTLLQYSRLNPDTPVNPFRRNLFYRDNSIRTFIAKYSHEIVIKPDKILIDNEKNYFDKGGCIFEMNAGKPIRNRIENLKRRQLAWANGLDLKYGKHYRVLDERGFIFPENEQNDIRLNPKLQKLYRQLQNL